MLYILSKLEKKKIFFQIAAISKRVSSIFIEKNLPGSEPTQFKLLWFRGQLY